MTDPFLESAGGYTPVPDKLVREYDYTTAYVWGKVWRYCQMANGTCTASHETIATRAGMSRRTLIEKLNVLIRDGYIEDKTPDLKNKPHTYCTQKGEIKITSTMQISHTESDTSTEPNKDSTSGSDMSMRIPHSDNAGIAQSNDTTMRNLHTSYAENAQPTMQNLHLKKDSLETPLRDSRLLSNDNNATNVAPLSPEPILEGDKDERPPTPPPPTRTNEAYPDSASSPSPIWSQAIQDRGHGGNDH